jgi:hypothetical protein
MTAAQERAQAKVDDDAFLPVAIELDDPGLTPD